MAFTSPMTAVTGATFTAAQFNTHVRDNLNAIWVGTTAGDLEYYSSSTAKARLAPPAGMSILQHDGSAPSWLAGEALKYLRLNADGTAFEWAAAGISVTTHAASPGTSYSTAAWRDVAGSNKDVTVSIQSTILCFGFYQKHSTDSPNYYGFFYGRFMIDGTEDITNQVRTTYGSGIHTVSVLGIKTGVAAGTRTCKLRETCDSGSYVIDKIAYAIVVVPE